MTRYSHLPHGLTVDFNHIAPVQFLPNRAQNDAEGLGIASLPADDLSGVLGMRLDIECGAAVSGEHIHGYEFRLVD